jgi:Fur family ferric uptake transcriptional regulator
MAGKRSISPRPASPRRPVRFLVVRLSLDNAPETEYRLAMMTDQTALLTALERAGDRLTESRRFVAELIATRDGHFTAADLVAAAEARPGTGRATIFRSLDRFTELGVVERLDLPDGSHAYVACLPSHHHHVVCGRCGRSVDVDDAGLRDVVREIADRTGFEIESHRLELFGRCPECRATEAT